MKTSSQIQDYIYENSIEVSEELQNNIEELIATENMSESEAMSNWNTDSKEDAIEAILEEIEYEISNCEEREDEYNEHGFANSEDYYRFIA